MDFLELGKQIARLGAPLLGGAVGGPLGAGLGNIIASVLGGDPDDPADLYQRIQADPDAAVKLREIELEHKTRFEEIALRRLEAELEAERGLRKGDVETQVADTQSEDPYVRQTRPKLLRRLFWLLAALTVFQHPLTQVLVVKLFHIDAATSKALLASDLGGQALSYVAMLFASSFGGYTLVRSMFDKQGLSRPDGPLGRVMNLVGGKKS